MSIDQSMHSLFGASKVAGRCADPGIWPVLRDANVLVLRGGCLTGPITRAWSFMDS